MAYYDKITESLVHPTYGSIQKSILIQELEDAIDNRTLDSHITDYFTRSISYINLQERYPKRKIRGKALVKNSIIEILHYMVFSSQCGNKYYHFFPRIKLPGYNCTPHISLLLLMCILHYDEVNLGITQYIHWKMCFSQYFTYNIYSITQDEMLERIRRISILGDFFYESPDLFRLINTEIARAIISNTLPVRFNQYLCPLPYVMISQLQLRYGLRLPTIKASNCCRLYSGHANCEVCLGLDLYYYVYGLYLKDVSLFDLVKLQLKL